MSEFLIIQPSIKMLQDGEKRSQEDAEAQNSINGTSLASSSSYVQKTQQELKGAPPREASWMTVGFLIITDIVGAGVMSLTSVRRLKNKI